MPNECLLLTNWKVMEYNKKPFYQFIRQAELTLALQANNLSLVVLCKCWEEAQIGPQRKRQAQKCIKNPVPRALLTTNTPVLLSLVWHLGPVDIIGQVPTPPDSSRATLTAQLYLQGSSSLDNTKNDSSITCSDLWKRLWNVLCFTISAEGRWAMEVITSSHDRSSITDSFYISQLEKKPQPLSTCGYITHLKCVRQI